MANDHHIINLCVHRHICITLNMVNNNDNNNNECVHHNVYYVLIIIFLMMYMIIKIVIQYKMIKKYLSCIANKITSNMNIIKLIIHVCVIPIINTIFPINDIEKKYDIIVSSDNNPFYELTQEKWNIYVYYLNIVDSNSLDLFDMIIKNNINKVNFEITLAICKTSTSPKYITYSRFICILKKIFGNIVNTRYRFTNNICFISVFDDDSHYRRFRYYDII
jgi:hypothetical protein